MAGRGVLSALDGETELARAAPVHQIARRRSDLGVAGGGNPRSARGSKERVDGIGDGVDARHVGVEVGVKVRK